MPANKIVLLLNKFYQMVSTTLNEFGALITSQNPGSSTAVFGAPFAVNNSEKCAIEAALALQKGVDDLNRKSEGFALPAILVSIGVSTGIAVCAAIGPDQLMQYSVIGEPVSHALEMELIARTYGATIVACNVTHSAIKDMYHVREVDIVSHRSWSQPFTIYEIMASSNSSSNHDTMSVISS